MSGASAEKDILIVTGHDLYDEDGTGKTFMRYEWDRRRPDGRRGRRQCRISHLARQKATSWQTICLLTVPADTN